MAKSIEIQIGRMVTTLKHLTVPAGTTFDEALEIAADKLSLGPKQTEEAVLNGDTVDGDTELGNGDTIMFVQSVAGAN